MLTYDRVEVIVFIKDEKDIGKYYRLFRLMLGDQVTKDIYHKDYAVLETSKVRMRFYIGCMNKKGMKAHYVINMVQDIEFHNICALPITVIHNYLKEDPKWSKLFNDKPEPFKAILRQEKDGWQFKTNVNDKILTTYDDLEGALFLIKQYGWTPVFSDEKLGFYTFTKERTVE